MCSTRSKRGDLACTPGKGGLLATETFLDKQTYRQTERQKDRKTDRQTETEGKGRESVEKDRGGKMSEYGNLMKTTISGVFTVEL